MCETVTTGPGRLPCMRTEAHMPGRGCCFDAGDVADKHDEGESDQ